ncbi:uncharacterized protein LOC131694791 [Topomyia yanbarensis]|uniref:uncharacterized protein LOC131687086 n=1 Tax=Topomyia yanbarensis TaxID=2498891 RepID=UPI00273B239A|nr:uncharacterized protein LOC131687086 [Topomyia yanbarensis]XP_058839278.1 uncharacterized protein LOC131694791 [Topomyia yanbarensis]
MGYYDKKRFTVFSLVREFMDQPSVTSATSQTLGKLVTCSDGIVQQLDAVGEEFTSRDPWLIRLLLEKLDKETRAAWSQRVIEKENPKFVGLDAKKDEGKQVNEKKLKTLHTIATNQKCAKSSKEHNTYQCDEFKKMSVQDRRELVKNAKFCSKVGFRKRSRSDRFADYGTTGKETDGHIRASDSNCEGAATIYIRARVLINSGSQASLIKEDCVRKLELPRRNGKLIMSGLGQQEAGITRGFVTLNIASRFDDIVVITTEAFILGKLTSEIPSQRFNATNMKLLENLNDLADPEINRPGPIDIILGSDVFLALLEGGQVKDESGLTVAQRTVFGSIVAGRYDDESVVHCINLHTDMDQVAEHFRSTLSRDKSGRFIVRLPFDNSKPALGDSLSTATKRLISIERRFQLQSEYQQEYTAFLHEYLELGHMEEVPDDQVNKDSSECYYLPHHAMIKEDSTMTKLRVVFDASCASSSGISLNDRLLAGPNNNADAKMYRQAAGFKLRKWALNYKYLITEDSADELSPVLVKLSDHGEAIKALGIQWLPTQDEYGFKAHLSPDSANTKRQVISDSSRLFDPFGWLAPVMVKIKMLYQLLWLHNVAWDDSLPSAVENDWKELEQLLENIRIPRYIAPVRGQLQLHGFSDASEQAFAAVVCARSVNDGKVSVVLVAAKSRVAPIKQVSLPRLELNATLLLTELMQRITETVSHLEIEH